MLRRPVGRFPALKAHRVALPFRSLAHEGVVRRKALVRNAAPKRAERGTQETPYEASRAQ